MHRMLTGIQDAGPKGVRLDDEHPWAIDILLQYFYTLQVPELEDDGEPLAIFIVADKYDTQPFKTAAATELIRQTQADISDNLKLSGSCGRLSLANRLIDIWKLEQDGSDRIRDAVLEHMPTAITYMIQEKAARKVLLNNQALVKDLLDAMAKNILDLQMEIRPPARGYIHHIAYDLNFTTTTKPSSSIRY